MRILITGANGQLGRQLQKQWHDVHEVVALDRLTGDVANRRLIEDAIAAHLPDVVVNAAAYTQVDRAETEQALAMEVNALGPENLMRACEKHKCTLIHISTDYVFDGTAQKPYEEWDYPTPLSVYGKSKFLGEKLLQTLGKRFFILRTSGLYGEGHNFVATMLRLAKERKQISVVKDQINTPTSVVDLGRQIDKLLCTDAYGLYHATCEGQTSWFEFARAIMKQAGLETEIVPIATEEYPVQAPRPKYSVLENSMLKIRGLNVMRPWEEALQEYIAKGRSN